MNTNNLKKFAQAARTKLIEQVSAKLNFVLTHDTAELRGKADTITRLNEEIKKHGKDSVIEKVAYTWFNRLVALRFMDANGYQPIGISVVSPAELTNSVSPQLLSEAHSGNIPSELNVNIQTVLDILDGRQASNNPDNDVYRLLLVAACNNLSTIFPFLFERIEDYTELLLPDDLTSPFSIIADIVNGMTGEECQEVEIIGWLYQFYISEKKDELINAKKKYKPDEIAPVTQLFTPKWIVRYMVDNTLGQYWKEARPNTKIIDSLEFYIKPNNPELIPERKLTSVQEIKFLDPCVGSAHILCYAFDIFYKMYEEDGYNPSEIPELILIHNLFGIDIDERAAQLAGFALMMKGRQYNRRFFRKSVQPNVSSFENFDSFPKFENAKVLGSLIKISKTEADGITVNSDTLFGQNEKQLKKQATLLSSKYDIVVTNPPYLNSNYMDGVLKQHVDKEFSTVKSDLFSCFLIQVTNFVNSSGYIGFICPYVWMFLQSFEKLRTFIIDKTTISSLVQLEYNAFGPAVVPIGTFVLRNELIINYIGSYVKLSEFTGVENQEPKTLEAIKNKDCGWFFYANQNDFGKIPGSPIGFWINDLTYNLFNSNKRMEEEIPSFQGMATTDNNQFMRSWVELGYISIGFNLKKEVAKYSNYKWFPYNKGGEFRKWYGNQNFVVNWFKDGEQIKQTAIEKYPYLNGNISYVIKENNPYYSPSISWTDLTTRGLTARFYPQGFLFDVSGHSAIYFDEKIQLGLLAYLNTKYIDGLSKLLNPSMHFQIGDFRNLPYLKDIINNDFFQDISRKCIDISKKEWNSREPSWDFLQNELIRLNGQDLEESYDLYQQYWKNKFFQLHRNEEELNRQFIEIYGLQDELTPDVPLEDITILKQETTIENGELVFHADEVFEQFVSYAVGCMFGRYSLDKEGLILANQGETLEDYLQKLAPQPPEGGARQVSFMPDEDNIIPVLDDEWFEDDIVARFHAFLKDSFGEKNFAKNLAFVEDCLGKDVRKYFTKDFYKDHVQRYKKRPIYWMFSSPKGYFNVLVYLHRYAPDTINRILNSYLKEFIEKLTQHRKQQEHIVVVGSATEQNKAQKEIDKIDLMLADCHQYEIDILYPLATERIALDLDDGVLVNYNKLGNAVAAVAGLNDKVTKKKVREFDWIDGSLIR